MDENPLLQSLGMEKICTGQVFCSDIHVEIVDINIFGSAERKIGLITVSP